MCPDKSYFIDCITVISTRYIHSYTMMYATITFYTLWRSTNLINTSARRYCDPSCLLVGWFFRSLVRIRSADGVQRWGRATLRVPDGGGSLRALSSYYYYYLSQEVLRFVMFVGVSVCFFVNMCSGRISRKRLEIEARFQ